MEKQKDYQGDYLWRLLQLTYFVKDFWWVIDGGEHVKHNGHHLVTMCGQDEEEEKPLNVIQCNDIQQLKPLLLSQTPQYGHNP